MSEGLSDDLPDGFFSEYPDTPRFIYGGMDQRIIYDRKRREKNARAERRSSRKDSPEDPGKGGGHDPDLFS